MPPFALVSHQHPAATLPTPQADGSGMVSHSLTSRRRAGKTGRIRDEGYDRSAGSESSAHSASRLSR